MRIKVENATKTFKNKTVLNNIDLVFDDGKIYGLIGKNGSGKTMLLRMIVGFIVPSKGRVICDGKQLGKINDFPESLGLIINKPDFPGFITGFNMLTELAGIKKIINEKEILNYMEKFDMLEYKDVRIKNYSLGMKQKIAVIQAIMEKPDLVVLDEPFNGLDEKSVNTLYNELKKLKDSGSTIIITSHHKEDIINLCDEIICIEDGVILPSNHQVFS